MSFTCSIRWAAEVLCLTFITSPCVSGFSQFDIGVEALVNLYWLVAGFLSRSRASVLVFSIRAWLNILTQTYSLFTVAFYWSYLAKLCWTNSFNVDFNIWLVLCKGNNKSHLHSARVSCLGVWPIMPAQMMQNLSTNSSSYDKVSTSSSQPMWQAEEW